MSAVAERGDATILAIEKAQEIVVRRKNEIGILFHISALLSDKDINILGVSAGTCGDDCLIRLITTDNPRAKELLAENGFVCADENVVLVSLSHRPGTFKRITKVLAQEGIDIRHVYAAADKEQGHCLVVLHTSNDDVALARLNDIQLGDR